MAQVPIPVSVIVPTLNEAANLPHCLAALSRFGEVIVVDSHSDDGTDRIAIDAGVRLERFRWDGSYPKKKEWAVTGLDLAYAWVLLLDADEMLTPALVDEIETAVSSDGGKAGYFIRGRWVFEDRLMRFGPRTSKLALVDRRRVSFPRPNDLEMLGSNEVEGHYQPIVNGPVGRLRAMLIHHDRRGIGHYLDRHARYAAWEAGMRVAGAYRSVWASESLRRRIVKQLFDRIPCRSLVAFVHAYVITLGVLDRGAGFRFALSRAFYYWQIGLWQRALRRPAQA